jgi:Cupin domain
MSLGDSVLTGPGAGRTVTRGHGSSAGDEPPIHIHTPEDETLYVLDGAITAFVDDQRIEVEGGLVRGAPQRRAPGPERARRGSAAARHARACGYGVPPSSPRRKDADPARFGLILQQPAMAA